jgi:hypothetical protein
MSQTTIRVQLAKNRMTVSDLIKKTGLARETINSLLDGNYDTSKVSSLRKVEKAIPGIRLVVGFENSDQ